MTTVTLTTLTAPLARAATARPAAPAKIKFDPVGSGFHAELKRRVDAYFDERGLSRNANASMVAKTTFWIAVDVVLYVLLLTNALPTPLAWLACAGLGFCFATVGMNIGHDALHGAYAKRPWVNRVLGWTFQLKGATSSTWQYAHNVIHHTYTNVAGWDTDLEPGPWMRFHDHGKRRALHRFQHWYAWFLYGFTTLVWIFKKDFQQALEHDPRTGKRLPWSAFVAVCASKVFHAIVFFALPLALIDAPLWQFVVGYLTMHFVAGVTLATIFSLAHVVEGPDHFGPPQQASSWAEHQLRTTANFGIGSFWCQFICGGLNHQVEHHLFPRICHAHYSALAPIVEKTAREFGLPYYAHRTFFDAVKSHARVMRALGSAPQRA